MSLCAPGLQGVGVVSELTTCWALVSLKRCAELTREMDISVPLYTGSIYQPVSGLSVLQQLCSKCSMFPAALMLSDQPVPNMFSVKAAAAAITPVLVLCRVYLLLYGLLSASFIP